MTRQAISPRFAIRILRNTSAFPGRTAFHPRGLALLEERADALAALGRDADFGDALCRVVDERVGDRAAARHRPDQVLDLAHRFGSALHEMPGNAFDRRIEPSRGD